MCPLIRPLRGHLPPRGKVYAGRCGHRPLQEQCTYGNIVGRGLGPAAKGPPLTRGLSPPYGSDWGVSSLRLRLAAKPPPSKRGRQGRRSMTAPTRTSHLFVGEAFRLPQPGRETRPLQVQRTKRFVILSDPERSRGGVEGSVPLIWRKRILRLRIFDAPLRMTYFFQGCVDSKRLLQEEKLAFARNEQMTDVV